MGYEAYRELVFERQKQLGIFPENAELTPLNPYAEETSVDGKPWNPARRRAAVGLALRRREAAVLPHGRGLRRLPQPHRPRDRAAARLPRGDGRAREHDRRASSPTTARAARAARTARSTRTSSSTASPTRSRRTCSTSTSSARRRPTTTTRSAGRGRSTRRSRCGSATTSKAASPTRWSSRGRRASRPRASCGTSSCTRPTSCRRCTTCLGVELPGGRQGLPADPARGRELPLDVRERRRADAEGDRLLLDARLARDLAQGLEGGQRPPDDRRLGPLRPGSLGALRHRRGPDREPRPRRRAPGRSCRS